MNNQYRPARLSIPDLARVGASGLGSRPTRVLLSALGIAIGIAAMVAVIGISTSSRAQFDRELATVGTNLLTVDAGTTLLGKQTPLPAEAPGMVRRIPVVEQTSSISSIDAKVYRSALTPKEESGGIATYAADVNLRNTLSAKMKTGTWLNAATSTYPTVVLGNRAAQQLGIHHLDPQTQILIGGRWFSVIGVLNPIPLATDLDLGVFIGNKAAHDVFGADNTSTRLYVRTNDSSVNAVRDVLAATVKPAAPNEVKVSRPSDALTAKAAADSAFTGLLVGLGAIALLVGGVGVANTMVISVLERRGEIGLRRSLGATRHHIRTQFLTESLLLASIGGLSGVIIGVVAVSVFTAFKQWPTVVPAEATLGGILATIAVGALAGIYPAARAARLSPTEALATP